MASQRWSALILLAIPWPADAQDAKRNAVTISWKGSSAKFRLANRDQFVEAQAFSGDAPLRIDCPGRFVVLPDFFADDILVDARKLPIDQVELPSENFVLH